MIDWSAIADLTLTGALVVAVVTLWRENLRLVDVIINDNKKSEEQRLQIMRQLASVSSDVKVIGQDTHVQN